MIETQKLHLKRSLAESMSRVAATPIENLNGGRRFGPKTLTSVYVLVGLLLPAAIVTSYADAPPSAKSQLEQAATPPPTPNISNAVHSNCSVLTATAF